MRPNRLTPFVFIFIGTSLCLIYVIFFKSMGEVNFKKSPDRFSIQKNNIDGPSFKEEGNGMKDAGKFSIVTYREKKDGIEIAKSDQKKITWEVPSNPMEEEMPLHSSQEVKRKLKEAERLWKIEMDQLFTPDTAEMKELRLEYQKMQTEFKHNRFQIPPPSEADKNKSIILSRDEMDDDAKYVQDYDDQLRHLLGEELFNRYDKKRKDFKLKALNEKRFPVDF